MPHPYTLRFRRYPEEKPHAGEEIWFLSNSAFYGTHDFKFHRAEIIWCSDDPDRGETCSYSEGDQPMPEHHLVWVVDGTDMKEGDLWVPVDKVWELLARAREHLPCEGTPC